MKFYKCNHCGKIINEVSETFVPVICCGEKMGEIIAGTVDASREKHIPVYQKNGNLVEVLVGSVEHPMSPEHYIEFIVIETKNGYQLKYLKPSGAPKATFNIVDGEELVGVYAYCNLHGLWKA